MSELRIDTQTEWLAADGLGGFASGTTAGVPTRRYHALLLAAQSPPTNRFVLVNGFVAWLETPNGRRDLTRHHYAPGVTTQAAASIDHFESDPWPKLRYRVQDGLGLVQEVVVEHERPVVLVTFRLDAPVPGVWLCLRPLLSGRDFHHLQHENPAFRFEPRAAGRCLEWHPYDGVPAIVSLSNGVYSHEPDWYRQFRYEQERARGLDCDEDLAAPGVLRFDLSQRAALWLLAARTPGAPELDGVDVEAYATELFTRESARGKRFSTPLERASDAYVVRRGSGRTLIAGYPWFSDWGRDTFIALRGLLLATERFAEARDILVEWAGVVSEGMLPNRFPDRTDQAPEYNSVDASLWYVIATSELLNDARARGDLSEADRGALKDAMLDIVSGYAAGTRFGIRRDTDGLLSSGEPGVQLTWMDAKVGDCVVTPRSGKAVEIQALWLNALHAARRLSPRFEAWLTEGCRAFETRFWNEARGSLFDVVDVDYRAGAVDASLRPNQIFAAGGLPFTPLGAERARRVVDSVEASLLTPLGLRSLERGHPAYRPRYEGGVFERDTAYHQGTVWPWLMGPFVEAWVKSRGDTREARLAARERFLPPLHAHLERAGLGHISEIADAEPPHTPRGCPFQAWSVSELLRLERRVLVL